MTTQFFSLLLTALVCFMASLVFGQHSNTQYDDLYFDGVAEVSSYSQTVPQKLEATANQDEVVCEDEISTTESIQQNTRSYENYAQERGNAEPYDYQYASRIRRFHNPAPGFSYYSNYYVDSYWYDRYAANFYGTSIYIGPSLGWNRWGWSPYNRWNNPYCDWHWRNYHYNNSWHWRNHYYYNSLGWNNSWNTGYNYVASTPNAGNFTNSIRGIRGATGTRVNGQHVATSPSGRSTTSSIDPVRTNRTNGRSMQNNYNNNTRVTTNNNRTTIVRQRRDDSRGSSNIDHNVRSNTRGSYTPSTRSNSTIRSNTRGSYTPSTRSNSTIRSNTRGSYTPSTRSNSTIRSNTRGSYTPSTRSNSTIRSNTRGSYTPSTRSNSTIRSNTRSSYTPSHSTTRSNARSSYTPSTRSSSTTRSNTRSTHTPSRSSSSRNSGRR